MERSDGQSPGLLEHPTTPAPRLVRPVVVNWLVPLLLIYGVELWLLTDRWLVRRPFELLTLAALIIASLVPAVQRVVDRAADWLNRRRGASIALIATILLIGSCCYFLFTDLRQEKQLFPVYQDEFSYRVQAQMLARGRLWMPRHPLGDFFDTFYLIVDPVYASMYFPGTAMLLVPGVWLGLPSWVMPLLLSGATVAMAFVLYREALHTTAGLLAALSFVGLSLLRMLSTMSLSAVPALLLGMTVIWAWLRWRNHPRQRRWLILLGVASGWLAITRPADAVCFALPVWIMLLLDLRRQHRLRLTAIAACAAAPFLMLQMVFDRGVTGHWFQTPFGYYTDRDYPNVGFGFARPDLNAKPVSIIPQKQAYYRGSVAQLVASHRPIEVAKDWIHHRSLTLFRETLPDTLLLMIAPLGLLGGVWQRKFVPFLLVLPLFVLIYSFYTFFIVHYVIIAAPTMILLVLLSAETSRPWLRTMCRLLIVGVTVLSLPEFHRAQRDTFFYSPVQARVNQAIASLPHTPAVVLFKYSATQSLEEEPVYNDGVAWPDDATVIRAHDLGERNREIFDYYARREPRRAFYRYDRADDSLQFLGYASDLAR